MWDGDSGDRSWSSWSVIGAVELRGAVTIPGVHSPSVAPCVPLHLPDHHRFCPMAAPPSVATSGRCGVVVSVDVLDLKHGHHTAGLDTVHLRRACEMSQDATVL